MERVRFGQLIAKRWPVVLGILLIAAVAGLLCWAPWEPREPVYNGEPLSYWLDGGSRTGGPLNLSFPALEILGDSNAVPFLANTLDAPFGRAYSRMWPKIPPAVRKHLWAPDYAARGRIAAAHMLGRMGPLANPAIPALLRALKDNASQVQTEAARSLGATGKGDETVTTALVAALKDKNPGLRQAAAESLGKLGRGDETVIKALTSVQQDQPLVSFHAALALWQLGKRDQTVVAALTAALSCPNASIREYATNSLLQIDPEAAAKAGVKPPSP